MYYLYIIRKTLVLIKNYFLDGFVKVMYSEKVKEFSTVDLIVTAKDKSKVVIL